MTGEDENGLQDIPVIRRCQVLLKAEGNDKIQKTVAVKKMLGAKSGTGIQFQSRLDRTWQLLFKSGYSVRGISFMTARWRTIDLASKRQQQERPNCIRLDPTTTPATRTVYAEEARLPWSSTGILVPCVLLLVWAVDCHFDAGQSSLQRSPSGLHPDRRAALQKHQVAGAADGEGWTCSSAGYGITRRNSFRLHSLGTKVLVAGVDLIHVFPYSQQIYRRTMKNRRLFRHIRRITQTTWTGLPDYSKVERRYNEDVLDVKRIH
ncbi:hypothetical protein IW261DRAFT_1417115 [Armillaria novae-zelandiae]|uniref:Uncharacterized protein n=1 Tax=Armillaria novae-zelandiae TaxID=153914 RepID=A0AA39PFB9_9AGAR|nr:hypothetical protein IW261DRAFT_1417115 [Armillaria novae-zelandiae]